MEMEIVIGKSQTLASGISNRKTHVTKTGKSLPFSKIDRKYILTHSNCGFSSTKSCLEVNPTSKSSRTHLKGNC